MSPYAAPNRLIRVRRAAVVVSVVVAALIAAIWIASQFRCLIVSRAAGSLARIENVPDGQMGAWEYRARTWSFQTYPHQFRVVRSEYLSVMQHAEEAERFAETQGWGAGSFSRSAIRDDYNLLFALDATGWRAFGLGRTDITRGGQALRFWDVPYWMLIAVLGAPGVAAWRRSRRRQHWARDGRCMTCGYQLDQAMSKCPECGTERVNVLV